MDDDMSCSAAAKRAREETDAEPKAGEAGVDETTSGKPRREAPDEVAAQMDAWIARAFGSDNSEPLSQLPLIRSDEYDRLFLRQLSSIEYGLPTTDIVSAEAPSSWNGTELPPAVFSEVEGTCCPAMDPNWPNWEHIARPSHMVPIDNTNAINVTIIRGEGKKSLMGSDFDGVSSKAFKCSHLDSPRASTTLLETDLVAQPPEGPMLTIPEDTDRDPVYWIASIPTNFTTNSYAQVSLDPRIKEGSCKSKYLLDIGLMSSPQRVYSELVKCVWKVFNRNVVTTGQPEEREPAPITKTREQAVNTFTVEKVTLVATLSGYNGGGKISVECEGPFLEWTEVTVPQEIPIKEYQLCCRLSGGEEPCPFHIKSRPFTLSRTEQ